MLFRVKYLFVESVSRKTLWKQNAELSISGYIYHSVEGNDPQEGKSDVYLLKKVISQQ